MILHKTDFNLRNHELEIRVTLLLRYVCVYVCVRVINFTTRRNSQQNCLYTQTIRTENQSMLWIEF